MVLVYTGNNVRILREKRGLNQRQLAEKAHVAQSMVSDIELGKRKPWPKVKRDLAEVLGVPEEELFGSVKPLGILQRILNSRSKA